ncbi:MAG: manganese efflux pump [Candidatus Omnitrophica bacterium]|nr:manganese efflux pump [Candidatus Omnitrophota bacterium]
MNWFVILLTAVGLAMDAFAVAVAAGAGIRERRVWQALRIGGSFGFFQMIMPLAGWLLGSRLKQLIMNVDHWVVFVLLALIGAKMLHESFSGEDCRREREDMTWRRLFLLSVATSVDAFAIGIGFAFLGYPIWLSAVVIGLVTFVLSTSGVFLGHVCSCLWGRRAELVGGVVLILIGLKILWEHLRV